MIDKFASLVFFVSFCDCQWAFLGGYTNENNPGKYSGKNLWPSARFSPGYSFDGKIFFMFGGWTINGNICNMWALDVETLEWKLLGPSNDPRTSKGSMVDQGKFSPNNWPAPLDFVSMFTRQDLLYLFPCYFMITTHTFSFITKAQMNGPLINFRFLRKFLIFSV